RNGPQTIPRWPSTPRPPSQPQRGRLASARATWATIAGPQAAALRPLGSREASPLMRLGAPAQAPKRLPPLLYRISPTAARVHMTRHFRALLGAAGRFCPTPSGLLGVEPLAGRDHLLEQRGRLEAAAEPSVPVVEALEQGTGAERVRVAERAGQVSRKPQTEDRPDIPISRTAQDFLAQTTDGFVHHLQRAALGHLPWIDTLALCTEGKQRVGALVDPLLLLVVGVKPLLALST